MARMRPFVLLGWTVYDELAAVVRALGPSDIMVRQALDLWADIERATDMPPGSIRSGQGMEIDPNPAGTIGSRVVIPSYSLHMRARWLVDRLRRRVGRLQARRRHRQSHRVRHSKGR